MRRGDGPRETPRYARRKWVTSGGRYRKQRESKDSQMNRTRFLHRPAPRLIVACLGVLLARGAAPAEEVTTIELTDRE